MNTTQSVTTAMSEWSVGWMTVCVVSEPRSGEVWIQHLQRPSNFQHHHHNHRVSVGRRRSSFVVVLTECHQTHQRPESCPTSILMYYSVCVCKPRSERRLLLSPPWLCNSQWCRTPWTAWRSILCAGPTDLSARRSSDSSRLDLLENFYCESKRVRECVVQPTWGTSVLKWTCRHALLCGGGNGKCAADTALLRELLATCDVAIDHASRLA